MPTSPTRLSHRPALLSLTGHLILLTLGLSGVALAADPQTGLEAPVGTVVSSGATFTFPTTAVGSVAELKVRLKNIGDGWLGLKNVYLEGTRDFAQFSIEGLDKSAVSAGLPLEFSLKFKPISAGTKTTSFKILTASNSTGANPFILNLVGTATAPTMSWQEPVGTTRNSTNLNIVFDTIFGTGSQSKAVAIRNSGTGDSIGSVVSITGTDASSFSVTALPSTTIAAGEVKTVTVTFNPTSTGNKSAQLNFTRSFTGQGGALSSLNLTGTVMPVGPEIVVEEPAGTNRNSGAGLAFGEAVAATDSFKKTITIKNIGNQALASLARSIIGTNASDFSVTALSSTSLAAGSQLQLEITYAPALAGSKTAVLRIASNDADENPFELNLSGTAIAPVLAVARTGVAVAASGQAVPGMAGVTYTDFFQVQTNATGECAFYATLSNGGTAIMSNGGLGRTAAPVKGLAVGDDPAGGGGAISAVSLLRLQNNGTVNSVVVRGPTTATQPITAVFRGSTQAVKVGDTPPKPLTAQTYASIGPIKSMTVSLDEGVGGVLADFEATPTGATTATRFTNVYVLRSTGPLATQQVSTLLDTTFVSVTPTDSGSLMSALQQNSPGTKTARTVFIWGGSGTTKVSLFPTTTADDVFCGEVRAGNYFYQYNATLSSLNPGYGRALVKASDRNGVIDSVFSASQWQDELITSIGRAAMSDNGAIYFEAVSFEQRNPKLIARTARNNRSSTDSKVLLKEGMNAPGLTRHVISKIFNGVANSFAISGGGKCVMRVTVTPTYGAAVAKEALYYVDEASTATNPVVLLAAAGDTIPVGTGTKTITGFDLQLVWMKGINNGPRAINDAGQVAALVKCGNDRVVFSFNTPQ